MGFQSPDITVIKPMITAQTLCAWIDLFWIPVALVTMERGKRLFTAFFVLACAVLLRLQVELLTEMGYPRGFIGLMDSALLVRGQVVYSVFILIFMLLAFFSKGGDKNVHIAASISIMIVAFCVSSLVMVL